MIEDRKAEPGEIEMVFRHIVSLGYNCEVSFRIEDYTGQPVESYPFSWAYVKNQEEMSKDLELALSGKLTAGGYCVTPSKMFLFYNSGCLFHSKAVDKDELLNQDGSTNYNVSDGYRKEIDSRLSYLQKKFKSLLISEERVLYIIKLAPTKDEVSTKRIIKDVISFFQEYGKNWHLLIVTKTGILKEGTDKFEDENVSIRTISNFAEDGNTKYGGNRVEWLRMISSIDHRYGSQPEKCDANMVAQYKEEDFAEQYIHALEIIDSQRDQIIEMENRINIISRLSNERMDGIQALQQSMDEIWNSYTWKVGKAMMMVPRWLNNMIKRTRENHGKKKSDCL